MSSEDYDETEVHVEDGEVEDGSWMEDLDITSDTLKIYARGPQDDRHAIMARKELERRQSIDNPSSNTDQVEDRVGSSPLARSESVASANSNTERGEELEGKPEWKRLNAVIQEKNEALLWNRAKKLLMADKKLLMAEIYDLEKQKKLLIKKMQEKKEIEDNIKSTRRLPLWCLGGGSIYNTIVNPITGRKVNINGRLGRNILQNYINQF